LGVQSCICVISVVLVRWIAACSGFKICCCWLNTISFWCFILKYFHLNQYGYKQFRFPFFQTASVPEVAEIVSRQETGHLTAPEIVPVTSENDISNEDHYFDVDNELFTEETNVTEHRAECSCLCGVCNEVCRANIKGNSLSAKTV
jgi:hypothetical protein